MPTKSKITWPPPPRRMADAEDVAQQIVSALGAEFHEDDPAVTRIARALRPLMEKLVPHYYTEGTTGEESSGNPGDTPR